jgi:nucleolar complex protein 3
VRGRIVSWADGSIKKPNEGSVDCWLVMELRLRVLDLLAGNFFYQATFFSEAAERPHPQNFTQHQHTATRPFYHHHNMARIPAIKRRKLTTLASDGEGSSPSTLENAPQTDTFFKQAASWNLEQDYETKPRKGKKKDKENTRLPIKTSEGLVQQVEVPAEAEDAESDLEWLGAEASDDEVHEEVVQKPTVPMRQQILEAKEELARIALMLNEDPEENIGAFKALAQFGQSQNTTIKKLALATQLAVYKDVIPGYRIRPLSEEDMEVKVSKEVKKLRAYEQALVAGYQAYIRELAKLAQSGKGGASRDGGPSLGSVAISCACALLVAVPHFNFRGELLKILVGKLSTRKMDADFVKCRETIETLFQNDDDGTPSLDAVSILTKMMKARGYRVDESVLNTFLHLRLLSEFSWKASTNHIDRPSKEEGGFEGKKLKEKRVFRTKKERKLLKERRVVEKEMVQADAAVSHEERDRMQAETLKLVFVTYFRILKIRSPNLMGAVLEGLARYAHLINQDFFGDLLEALKDLIGHAESGDDVEEEEDAETTRNLTREALLCIITAFALLEGQDAAKAQASLSLDLSFFITHLYQTLHALSLNPDIELSAKSLHLPDPNHPSPTSITTTNNKVNIQTTTVLLLRSLSSVLIPPLAARAVPPLRIAAFTKQLLTSSLHLPEKSCIAMMGLLGKVIKTHEKKIAALWNTEERRGDGVFDSLSGEVEGSNPFAATIWEGELLRRHFSPAVRDGVKVAEKNVLGLR